MAEPRRTQQIIDFDEIERQIRQSAQPKPRIEPRDDALADLARIVEQPAAPSTADGPEEWRRAGRFDPRLEEAMRSLEGFLKVGTPISPDLPPGAPPAGLSVAPAQMPADTPQVSAEPLPTEWTLRGAIDADNGRQPAVDLDEISGRMPENSAPVVATRPLHPTVTGQETMPNQQFETITSPVESGPYGAPADPPPFVEQGIPREHVGRSRKGLFVSASLLGIAAVGVAGALTFRGAKPLPAGMDPPLVKADVSPIKVGPANPGGIEVPNQNKLVLSRSIAPAPQPRVVASEEQPLDVKALAREPAKPRVILPPPANPGAAPAEARPVEATGAIAPAPPSPLGEPRRVRTVTIRPGTPGAPVPGAGPVATPAPAGPLVAAAPRGVSLPENVRAAPPPSPPVTPAPVAAPEPPKPELPKVEPVQKPETPPKARAATPETPKAVAKPPAPKPVKKPAPRVAQKPETPPATTDTPANPDAPTNITPAPARPRLAAVEPKPRAPAGGGAVVQVASATSEAEARNTLASLRSRFPELASANPSIQQAQVNGQTRWRIRAGGLSAEAAQTLCKSIQGKGGACFVAR